MTDPSSDTALSLAILDAAKAAGLDAVAVEGLTRLSGGASKESWAFDIALGSGERRELVLRRQPPGKRFATQGLDSV